MKRGDIYYADLSPTCGSEINKKRPVVIISCDGNNKYYDIVTVIPITSNIKNIFRFEVYLDKIKTLLKKDSKAACQQIRAISKNRIIGGKVGEIMLEDMKSIDKALRLHLNL